MLRLWDVLMDEAAGDGALGGGGGQAETSLAVIDTPTDVAVVDDDPTEEITSEEPAEQGVVPFRPTDATGRLTKQAVTALAPIKTAAPALYQQIHRDRGIASRLRAEFPANIDPFKAISGYKKVFKELGGEEGIQAIRDEQAQMQTLDLMYADGNPKMFDSMTETPEGKSAFVKITPHSINKLATLPGGQAAIAEMTENGLSQMRKFAPNRFAALIGSIMISDVIAHRFDQVLLRLAEVTPKDNALAVAELAKVQAYMDHLFGLEKLPAETLEKVEPSKALDPRQADLDKREQDLERQRVEMKANNWKTAADVAKGKIFDTAWSELTKGKRVSAVDKEDIQARAWARLPMRLKNTAGFSDALQSFFEANDRDGYLRYLQAEHQKAIPAVLKAEIQRRYGTATTAAATTAVPGTPRAQVDPGWKRVSAPPKLMDVDPKVNNRLLLWKEKKAVLRDGTKVQWG